MSKRLLIALFALLSALPAAAQDMPYPGDPPAAEPMMAFPEVGPAPAAGAAFAGFAPGQVLTAAQLNAALAAPIITGGSINGAPIGASNPQAGSFTSVTALADVLQMAGTSTFVGGGTFQIGDNSRTKRTIINSWITPTGGVMTPPLLVQGNAFGTITSAASVATFRAFNVSADTVNATGAQGGGLAWNYFGGTISSGAVGGRDALKVFMRHAGPSTAGPKFYVAGAFFADSVGSAGGTSGTPAGNLFGSNISSLLRTGSGLYWNQAVGLEVNVGAETGTGVQDKVGLQIVQWSTDAVAGTRSDIGLLIGAQSYAQVIGWDRAIAIGAPHATWPIRPSGAIMALGEQNKQLPARYPIVVARGIDFASVPAKFTTAAYASPGWAVDGAGQHSIGPATLGWTTRGLSIGAAGKTAVLASVAAGGTAFRATDILRDAAGGVWEVATVSSGAITGLTLIKAPTIASGAAPSNPVALSGGMGTGATINLTWTDAPDVTIASGRLRVSAATIAAAGTNQAGAAAAPLVDLVTYTTAAGQTGVRLPPAVAGASMILLAATTNSVNGVLYPDGAEVIRAYTTSFTTGGWTALTPGQVIRLTCFADGVWTATGSFPP